MRMHTNDIKKSAFSFWMKTEREAAISSATFLAFSKLAVDAPTQKGERHPPTSEEVVVLYMRLLQLSRHRRCGGTVALELLADNLTNHVGPPCLCPDFFMCDCMDARCARELIT